MDVQIYRLTWQNIEVEIRYKPRDMGNIVAHLEIETTNPPRAQLPMTETGYRSHFHAIGTIEAYGGDVVQFVADWLDEEAKSKKWLKYIENMRQDELF